MEFHNEVLTMNDSRALQTQTRICPHFGACGGCVAQDRPEAGYPLWKENFIHAAFRRYGFERGIDAFIACPPASRRRIVLAFARSGKDIVLGFHAARSHIIVPIHTCLVTRPELVSILPGLRELLSDVVPKKTEGTLTLLASESGIDAAIEGVKDPTPLKRSALADAATRLNLARLSVNGDMLVQLREPVLKIGRALVVPPAGSFVQAVAQAEEAIAEKISAAFRQRKIKRIADLFAGCGAFTLRMAEFCAVHAVEANGQALHALQKAAQRVSGFKPVNIEKRDLFRRPLLKHELNAYDAVILDPPRQGAQAQIAELCKSKVELIAYVSCNPETFARDAKKLADAGYKIDALTAIDQFLWSEHVELIAIFVRPR